MVVSFLLNNLIFQNRLEVVRLKSINFAPMKRSLNILMALLLSLMVVYMSVETTVMHCLSYNKVMVGTMADCLIFSYLQIDRLKVKK